jgi:hypothetical protein
VGAVADGRQRRRRGNAERKRASSPGLRHDSCAIVDAIGRGFIRSDPRYSSRQGRGRRRKTRRAGSGSCGPICRRGALSTSPSACLRGAQGVLTSRRLVGNEAFG